MAICMSNKSLHINGPQRPETQFQLRQRDDVGPGFPHEYRPNSRPVDTGDSGDFANAATVHGLSEIHNHETGSLGDGVAGGDMGPVDT